MSPKAPNRTRMLWLTGLLHGFTHVYHVALIPLYLLIQRDLRLDSVGMATSLVTILMTAYFLPSYLLGILADRMSRKNLLGWGLAINGLGFVALSFAPNYPTAVAAIVIAGIGGSCYHPAATAMIARLAPTDTGKALGLVGIGAGAGFFLGPIYAGWRATMLEPTLGAIAWRRPVLELGLLGILAAAFFGWLAHDEKPADATERHAYPAGRLFPTMSLWFFFIACCLAFALRDFAGAGSASLGSLFLQKAQGYDPREAGMAVGGLFLGSIIGNPLLGGLSDGRRKRWITGVLLISSALIAVFPRLPGRWTFTGFLVFGFFYLSSYPMVEAMLMQSVPDAVRGRVFGFFVTVTGLFGNLSHWTMGAQVKRMGDAAHSAANYYPLYAILAVFGALSLLGLPCLYAIRKREHLEEKGEVPSAKDEGQSPKFET